MRSLVSDLIPEYNKKLQFFSTDMAYVMDPVSAHPYHEHVCAISIDPYGKLPYGNFTAYTLYVLPGLNL